MYILKRLIKLIVLGPSLWILLLVVVLAAWRRRWARKFLLGVIILIFCLHSSLIARWIGYPLEAQFPPLMDPQKAGPYDAIVVLSGGSMPASGLIPFPVLDQATSRRLEEALRLYRLDPKPVIVSGGHGNPFTPDKGENAIVCSYLIQWGVPAGQVIGEAASRDTFESAVEVRGILQKKGWKRYLLVTSAQHMPRSMLVFKAIAPEPIPAPGDFSTAEFEWRWLSLLPSDGAARANYMALHEYLGWLNYRLRLYYDF